MKKVFALVLSILFSLSLWANMASPIKRGSAIGFPFVSDHVTVSHENLRITPAANLETCRFRAEYDIFADTSGIRIPMLFVAEGYQGGMKIRVNGQSVSVTKLPDEFYIQKASPLSQFNQDNSQVEIEWEKGVRQIYALKDLHYFEFELSAGPHQIWVQYDAQPWIDRSDWVAQKKFLYALSPARNWKSFGKLDIVLDAKLVADSIATNLGQPQGGNLQDEATWHFDHLPEIPTLEISVQQSISAKAQFLIDFGMEGFLWASGALFTLIHIFLLWRWRRKHYEKWYSWVWLLGSFMVPFLAMVVFLMSAGWINDAIGPAAARRGGYQFLIFIFYPVVLIGYGLATLLVDHLLRQFRLKKMR